MSSTGLTSFSVRRCRSKTGGRPERGFALLVTITLLAFLVLLLVSLATLTRVETQVAANNQQLTQARQNALLGLNVALGRLQALSGPDQRVTATADLVANRHLHRKRWTGVWNTDPAATDASGAGLYGQNLGWLVSGAVPAGTAGMNQPVTAGSDSTLVDLVGPGSALVGTDAAPSGEGVRVSTQPIGSGTVPGLSSDPAGHTIGHFAYWVGDEGVKARVSLIDPHAGQPPVRQIYSFLLAQRLGGELVESAAGARLGALYPVNADVLSKVLSIAQLPYVTTDTDGQAVLRTAAKARFHDLTFQSASVLADVAQGGLKKDLTAWLGASTPATGAPADTDYIAAEGTPADNATDRLPQWGLIRSYAGLTTDGVSAFAPRAQTDTTVGVYPTVTYFKLGIGLSCEGDGQPLRVQLFPEVVLWNPYNIPLQAGDYDVGLRVAGTVGFQIDGATKATLDLSTASLASSPTRFFRFRLVLAEDLPPGVSWVFTPAADLIYDPAGTQPLPVLTPENPPNRAGSVILEGPAMSAAERLKTVTWLAPAGGNAQILLWPAGGSPATGTSTAGVYQAIQQIGYGASAAPSAQVTPEAIMAARLQLRFQAVMSRGAANHITSRWIAQQNMRAPVVDRSGAETGNLPLYYGSPDAGASLPVLVVDENRAGAGLGVSRVTGSADRLILAEFQPAGVPLVSLAQLQHANLAKAGYYPGYAVGNSLPNSAVPLADASRKDAGWTRRVYDLSHVLNRALWDRYFFSTVPAPADLTPADIASEAYHLPNARHGFRRDGAALPAVADLAGAAAFHTAAAHLSLAGGFNVNSTSVDAWRALLGGRQGVAYDPVARSSGAALDHPFSRFTVPAGGPNNAWEGYRTLTAAAIDGLAVRIVEQIKARGPFLSLADFVNRKRADDATGYAGALQAALDAYDVDTTVPVADRINLRAPFDADAVTSSTGSTWDIRRMQGGAASAYPRSSRSAFAPGYLTQADLLTAIGPTLTARSDTFVIRAYGEVQNPATGAQEGRAWCEALVQRSPEFVVAGEAAQTWPAVQPDNRTFGRRYRVVSFRWLNLNDL